MPNAVIDILLCVSSPSPVCSYLYPSEEVLDLVMELFETNIKSDVKKMKEFQEKIPLFFNLLVCFSIETSLPDEWKGLIILLTDIARKPFINAELVNTKLSDESNNLSWYLLYLFICTKNI